MEDPGGSGGGSGGGIGGGRGVPSAGCGSGIDDPEEQLDELWPSRPSSAAAMLASIWHDNPASSDRFTLSLGGVDLDPELWDVRIHFDGVDNIERKIERDDVTFMNIVALIEKKGYSITDAIYCQKSDKMELIDCNEKIYELLDFFDGSKILNLTVKRGRAGVSKKRKVAGNGSGTPQQVSPSSLIKYAEPVVYDFFPPDVYSVDREGTIFPTQAGSSAGSQNPYVSTQESVFVQKGKGVQIIDSDDEEEGHGTDHFDMGEGDEFDMGEADFAEFARMEEERRKEDADIAEKIDEMRRKKEDPLLHCEGDTDIEDLYVTGEDTVTEVPAASEPMNKKRKKPARKGPTERSHSAVQGHKYTSYTKALRPDLLMRKNKHVAPDEAPSAPPSARQTPTAAPPSGRQAPPASAPPSGRQAPPAPAARQAPQQSHGTFTGPRQAFVPPRTNEAEQWRGPRYVPAYERTRMWSYLNCTRREGDEGEAGSSNN